MAGAGSVAGRAVGRWATTLGKVVVKFTGCEIKASSCEAKVSSLAAKEGEVVTDSLKGELGTVNTKEATSGLGLLLEPETGTIITTFTQNACFGQTTLNGDIAAEVAVTGKKQLTNMLVFVGVGHIQKIKEIAVKGREEEPELEGWGTTLSMTASDELTFEEALEVT